MSTERKPTPGRLAAPRRLWLVAVLLLNGGITDLAAQTPKATVSVDLSAEDAVGQRLGFAVREAVRTSAGYELVSGPKALFRISLVTLDPDHQNQGNWSAVAVAFTMRNLNPYKPHDPQTWYPIELTVSVLMCGSKRVEEVATGILASLDAAIETYRADARQAD